MKRESLKMQEEDFEALTAIAARLGCIYSGQPSWRRLVLRIARGEIRCTEVEASDPAKPKKTR